MSKHTPAPWVYNPENYCIMASSGDDFTSLVEIHYPLCTCPDSDERYECDDEFEANLHLMQSAPEMYEALRDLLPQLKGLPERFGEEIQEIETILAKVEGRES